MKCPKCEHRSSKVLDTSVIGYGKMIKRRRQCRQCSHRWTTIETESATSEEVLKQAHRIIRAYERFREAMGDHD